MPRPPQNRTTFTSGVPAGLEDLRLGNGHDELAAPFTDVTEPVGDLLAEVPGQDQHVVRTGLGDPRRMEAERLDEDRFEMGGTRIATRVEDGYAIAWTMEDG